MEVAKKIKKIWDDTIEFGDFGKIAEKSGLDRNAIAAAKKTGNCTVAEFEAINDFVVEKRNRIEQSANKVIG